MDIGIKDILDNIKSAFQSIDGDRIADIHNDICSTKIEYLGDSIWVKKEGDQ